MTMSLQEVKDAISNFMKDCIESESYEDADRAAEALEMIGWAEEGKLIVD